MTDERDPARLEISGALIGWERLSTRNGVVMNLQLVETSAQYQDKAYHRVAMALNDRQLRSLARDLIRAAKRRGIDLRARPPLHRRLWIGLKALVVR